MNKKDILDLYLKERQYEEHIFGNYETNPCFNVATFLNFIEQYIIRAKKAYMEEWDKDMPPWLNNCSEKQHQDSVPVKTYEDLVKIFALAGAALEAFTDIDPEKWREEGAKDKWKKSD